MSKRDKQFWESALLNSAGFQQYYCRLTELAISMFEWKNVPDTIDVRYLELALFTDGQAVFFYDEDGEIYLCLRVAVGGELSVYRIPTDRTAYAANGYNKRLNESNSVIVWNNLLHTNSMLDTQMFAKRLYNIDRAIDTNVNAQKTPILIACDENDLQTMKNLYMKYDGNIPVIYGDKRLKPDSIKAISTGAPFVASQLYDLRTQIWNEALTYLGISNVNFTKKERMISDEVIRQNGGTIASRYSRLEARRQAADEINRMFGLNIEVNYRDDFREADDEVMFRGETSDDSQAVLATDLRTR